MNRPPSADGSDLSRGPGWMPEQYRGQPLMDQIGKRYGSVNPTYDPAHQELTDKDVYTGAWRSRVQTIFRDIPLVTIQNSWTVDQVRGALQSHMIGLFDQSGQMADSMLGDDRVQATLGSRIGGLFGREIRFKPANDSAAAKEVCDAWVEDWPAIGAIGPLVEIAAYTILMGVGHAQLIYDTTGPRWIPSIRPWHSRYTYYDWSLRRYVAIAQDGTIPIISGAGKWLTHAPFCEYRGWLRGAARAIAEPWLIRHFAIRDWARFSEIHGIPTRKAKFPASAPQDMRDAFIAQFDNVGSETTVMLPQGSDQTQSFDVELLEATDTSWESFPGLRDHCDMAIVLAIMFQNLTTEVQGGSFAAVKGHMDLRQGGLEFDNLAWRGTIRNQIAKGYAFQNFGDPSLAPFTDWDVRSKDDYSHFADQMQKLGIGLESMAQGGMQFTDANELREFIRENFGLRGVPTIKLQYPDPKATPTAQASAMKTGGIGK